MASNGPWFRHYTDCHRNLKLRKLPEGLQLRFFWLLELMKEDKLVGASIEDLCWYLHLDAEDVVSTLKALCDANLLKEDLKPKGWDDRQYEGDGKSTERTRKWRARQREQAGRPTERPMDVPNRTEQNKSEMRKKKTTSSLSCPEPITPPPSVIIEIPLSDGSLHNVTEKEVTQYRELYPAVNIMQQLREIKGWNLANPKRRKTRAGIRRHINAWLAREQNRGGNSRGSIPRQLNASRYNNSERTIQDMNLLLAEMGSDSDGKTAPGSQRDGRGAQRTFHKAEARILPGGSEGD